MKHKNKLLRTNATDAILWEMARDRPHYCGWVIAELDEPLCDDRIVKSLQHLIRLIPVLIGKPQFSFWRGNWEYREHVDTRRLVTRATAKTTEETACLINDLFNIPIYVERGPYIKVISIDGTGKHYFVVQITHFAMDGGGLISLLEQFAYCYRKIQEEPDWKPEGPLETERSSWQIAGQLKWTQFLVASWQHRKKIKDKAGTVIRGDFPGVSNTMHPENSCFETLRIKPITVAKVVNRTKNKGYTVNDVLMATTMSTVCQWNRERDEICQKVSTRFGVNLRRWGEPDGTYANMSSVETVEESVDKLLDVRTALQSLKPKLDEAKQTLGFGYFWWLLFLAPIPECLIRLIGRRLRKSLIETQNKSHAITNVGVIPENAGDFGHAHVLSYSILPPVSPRPNVFFVMHSFKGALTVNMSFSSKHMKPDTAKAFLEKWRQQFMSLW